MAKFYGLIGYVELKETEPGIWEESEPIERPYSGEMNRNFVRRENTNNVNDNININNEISIVSDSYADEHFFAIRYVKFNVPNIPKAWEVTNVTINYPRLILSIGGIYNRR